MQLLDINVWLGMAFQAHQNHLSARSWFQSSGTTQVYFCRVTQMGFLRLASNPQALGKAAVTVAEAWQAYDSLCADPRIDHVDEPAGIEPVWRSLTQHQSYSPKVWTDAYLAAFAELSGLEFVTFDQGFAQFKTIRCTILV
jgi:uncharacterized protein